jgi:hypothetical protein
MRLINDMSIPMPTNIGTRDRLRAHVQASQQAGVIQLR